MKSFDLFCNNVLSALFQKKSKQTKLSFRGKRSDEESNKLVEESSRFLLEDSFGMTGKGYGEKF